MSINDDLCVSNFGKICRTCLTEGEFKRLHEKCFEDICFTEMLTSVTFLQFSETDGLPIQICYNCEAELIRAYKFIQKSLRVDKRLRKCFQENEAKQKNKIKLNSPHTDNSNSKTITDKQKSKQKNAEQIKAEIVEQHEIEVEPEMVLVKDEIFSEEENIDIEYKDENINHDDSDDNDSDYLPENMHWLQEVKNPMMENCTICSKSVISYKMSEHMENHSKLTREPHNLHTSALIDCDEEEFIPSDIGDGEGGTNMDLNLLPKKSKKIYEYVYIRFMDYRRENTISSLSENVLVTYFSELSKKMKPSTLWATYSMLKATLIINNNLDIAKYLKLRAFLKHQAAGYQPKTTRIWEKEQITKFLVEAPDHVYLTAKVALIIGIAGACRCDELLQLKVNDVEDMGSKLLVTFSSTKRKKMRSFLVTEHLDKYRKYAALRPVGLTSQRFFFKYSNGKASKQLIGIHKFGSMPQEISAFLNLPNHKEYTGHCFRRTAAALQKY